METDNEQTKKGIRWTYGEVIKGRSGVIMGVELVFVAIAIVAGVAFTKDTTTTGSLIAALLNDMFSLKAESFAINLCCTIVVTIPVIIILWPFVAAVLTIIYNVRDRNVEATPENLEMHRIYAQRAWTWPWSIVVGVFDFTALFFVISIVLAVLGAESWSEAAQKIITLLYTVVCLVFAERRVTRVSHSLSGRLEGNYATVDALLDGDLDDFMPEDYRNDLGRAKAATVVRIGISRSPSWAVRVAKGIDLRTKVKLFSGFLNSTIHGVLTALSFGIAATAANNLGNVGGEFGAGRGKEYAQSLRDRSDERPWFIVDIISVLICVLVTTTIFFMVALTGEVPYWVK